MHAIHTYIHIIYTRVRKHARTHKVQCMLPCPTLNALPLVGSNGTSLPNLLDSGSLKFLFLV